MLSFESQPSVLANPQAISVKLVINMMKGDQAATAELYRYLKPMMVNYFRRKGLQDVEDAVHDSFIDLVKAIAAGRLNDPSCLIGYVRTMMGRYALRAWNANSRIEYGDSLDSMSLLPNIHDQDSFVDRISRIGMIRQALLELESLDREILETFYFGGQRREEIMQQLGLTKTSFRLRKNRAKAKLISKIRQNSCLELLRKQVAYQPQQTSRLINAAASGLKTRTVEAVSALQPSAKTTEVKTTHHAKLE